MGQARMGVDSDSSKEEGKGRSNDTPITSPSIKLWREGGREWREGGRDIRGE